jgi:hypothetical protein
MTYTSLKDIKANVKTTWSHPNCKFQRGDRVLVTQRVLPTKYTSVLDGKVRGVDSYFSKPIVEKAGSEGHVVAVSCTPDGLIRGKAPDGICYRMFTRYYVQFADRSIFGIHSHALELAE